MKVLSPVLFAVAVLSASSALAQEARIPFGDLDLTSTAGQITNRRSCRAAVRAEALSRLPRVRRVEYVRASRDARPVVRAATASDEG